jgi:hypothetical protein
MAYDIPTTEPSEFFVGDTVQWTKDLSGFPASAWTLKYNFISSDASAQNILITSTADGDIHSIAVARATSAGYTAGDYKWFSYVIDIGDTLRHSVASGSTTVKPDQSSGTDARSHVKIVLDAICATIEGVASKDQKAYSIAGRSLERYSFEELLKLKDKYEILYKKELSDEAIANGEGSGRKVKVRFTNV